MVVEEFPKFFDWFPDAVLIFLVITAIAIVLGTVIGFLVAAFRHGPSEAFIIVATVIAQSGPDFIRTSPRRVWAMTRLAMQESMRRRVVLVTFCIFSLALLIGGWFLNVNSAHPDELYITFVTWGTQLLVLFLGLLLSAFSLPQDIRNRTIYTVVTKPVRATEIVFGRILGFWLIGTMLLCAMGVISYFFVVRGVSHRHGVKVESIQEIDPIQIREEEGRRIPVTAVEEGITTLNSNHEHRFWILKNGEVVVEPVQGHAHEITVNGEGADAVFEVSGQVGNLQARIPLYASELRFLDRQGNPTDKGVNVGSMWGYRSYIEGGVSLARAIWVFEDVTPNRFDEGDIKLEMNLSVFRTHKGNIERRVTGTIVLRSEVEVDGYLREYESSPIIFESNEFQVQTIDIDRKLDVKWVAEDGTVQRAEVDFFNEFAPDGELELWLRCNEAGQYFGVARGDIYFKAAENAFYSNMIKSYVSIWLQLLIVVSIGVALSTLLNGPVTLLGTIGVLSLGFFGEFIRKVAVGDLEGGGPIESFIRVVNQSKLTLPIGTGIWVIAVQFVDNVLMNGMTLMTKVVPDFGSMNTSDFLAKGYDIDPNRIAIQIAVAFSFCFAIAIVGYFCLKTREIAK